MGKDCVAQKYSKNTSITIKDDKDGKKNQMLCKPILCNAMNTVPLKF